MPDSMPYQQCRQLKDEGDQLRKTQQYTKAVHLFKQAYDLCHDSYAASKYIHCLRKSGATAAREAVKFGRQVITIFPDDEYIKREYIWAIYDGYLKIADRDDQEEHERFDDLEPEKVEPPVEFKVMVHATRHLLKLTTEPLPRTLAVLALCKEAKRLEKWEVMREFAQQLDATTLSLEQKELNGRRLPSDYQKWAFYITRALLELEYYDECMRYAWAAIEQYPDDSLHFRRWEALAKIRSGRVQEGLSQLEEANIRFPKQWYIQSDIANAYVRLGRFDDAWLWYCRAVMMPGDIKGRIVTLRSICDLLQRLDRWQAVYEHLRLVWAIEEAYNSQQYAERTRQRINEFKKRYAEHLHISSETENRAPTIPIALKPCHITWQQALRKSGTIQYLNPEKHFGFIVNGSDRYHFSFDAFTSRDKPEVGMEVEFEPQESYDRKRKQPGKIAIHVRVVKKKFE